jgi:rhodanese-related sulfurtransferase
MLLALTSGGLLLWPALRKGAAGSGSVATSEAVRLINREKAVLIDVGDAAEFAAGHATGARHVPLAQLDGNKTLPTNKALPVVVLCPTGARASKAAASLRKAGFEKAVSVAGGTAAWREAQLPIEKSLEKAASKAT